MEIKICNYCEIEKSLDFFTKGKGKCKVCIALLKREKYKENPELFKNWAKNNPEKVKENNEKW